jgi:hypothetical protein
MFSFDLLIVLYCVIYLILIIKILKKARLKNPKLNIYSWVSDFFSYDDTIVNEVVLRFKMFLPSLYDFIFFNLKFTL